MYGDICVVENVILSLVLEMIIVLGLRMLKEYFRAYMYYDCW